MDHNEFTIKQQGFTIIELLAVALLVAIGATLAMPEMTTFVQRSRSQAVLTELHGSVRFARAQALASSRTVSICPLGTGRLNCGEDWTRGWMVFAGSEAPASATDILRIIDRVPTDVSIIVSTHSLSFNQTGGLSKSASDDGHRIEEGTAFQVCRGKLGDGDACPAEALSGRLTIEAGGSTRLKRS